MNIAHILPQSVTYPLKKHNGRYDWVLELARLQAKQGHTVTIYANSASVVPGGVLVTGITQSSGDRKQDNVATFRLALSHDHDVYHSHFDNLHYEMASETTKPIVATQHWWPSKETVALANTYGHSNVWAVPPTRYMYDFDLRSGIQSKGHIYHGIDLSVFKKSETKKGNRLLFVGRISPEKNVDIAISAALKAGVGLDIIGKIAPKNKTYWGELRQYIDGRQIRYLGTKSKSELVTIYAEALGTLCPFEPTEAFGLVSIESQACGTPVILKSGGSRGELVKEHVTGFLCTTEDEIVASIKQLSTLTAQNCIEFAQKFDIHAMVDAYDNLYTQLISSDTLTPHKSTYHSTLT